MTERKKGKGNGAGRHALPVVKDCTGCGACCRDVRFPPFLFADGYMAGQRAGTQGTLAAGGSTGMARKQSKKAQPSPTPEEVVALIGSQDQVWRARFWQTLPATPEEALALVNSQGWVWQARFLQLLLADPHSQVGRTVLAMMATQQAAKEYLEQCAGLTPEQYDPHHLLSTDETDQEAMRRTGKASVGAVRVERHKAKKRRQQSLLPPFGASTE
jgi:hypothetical protein